ncbi:alpha/beta fold hydrolase [Streptomyces coffeae]|uniref:Alpha/beta hydrolase n=1 Tax=Streptomyces coffeae TaxID=621382 RepID=A0ABS1NN44_9ACTN|nr:alpha/beta hydrolase [Streptomyces coffeae]MBL1101509.1 alpha/beta hydrolase [Streptomyces coffeae]
MTTTAPELNGFQEHFVDADGFRIRYYEGGEGEPLAVVHGAGGPADYAAGPALELLARDRRVIAFELPGFGQSEPNTRTADGRQMATTVASAMAALGIETYSVMGTSMGGIVALWWAVDHPEQVTSVVLEAPSAFRADTTRPAAMLSDRDVYIRAFHAHPERKPWLADFQLALPPNWDLVTKIMGPDRDENLVERLTSLEQPVLVLFGTQDGVISPDEGRHYKEAIQNCYFMLVYSAAHDLKGDRPEAFSDVVGDFLTHGPKFLVDHKSTVINP